MLSSWNILRFDEIFLNIFIAWKHGVLPSTLVMDPTVNFVDATILIKLGNILGYF